MKIYKTKLDAMKSAEIALIKCPLGSFIDEGSYKGGLYDCIFILHPFTGRELFSGAY